MYIDGYFIEVLGISPKAFSRGRLSKCQFPNGAIFLGQVIDLLRLQWGSSSAVRIEKGVEHCG